MKRKCAITALIICMCIIICSVPVSASDVPTVYIKDTKAKAGSTFTVDVMISGNPGINTFRFGFDYDTSLLTLDSAKVSSDFPGQFMFIKKAVWLASSDNYNNGTLLTLTFTLNDNAPVGDTPIAVTFSRGDICNFSEQLVEFTSVPGKITVISPAPGDINCDGKVNAVDCNLLKMMVIGEYYGSPEATKYADLDSNGKINSVDANIIKALIVGISFTFQDK